MKDQEPNNKFIGPLFIVGLSRSGTKLIRDLLNNNTRVSLPQIESHFLPKILADERMTINKAHEIISESLFVQRLPQYDLPTINHLIAYQRIENEAEFVEAILKYYASPNGLENWKSNTIWGDKTPSYLRHLDLLNSFFPQSKFIHIIRDPRDRALSVNLTWGKSMERATELWRREIKNASKWKLKKDRYLEIKYEDLINDAESVLKLICDFLEIDFSHQMLSLAKPSEKHGNSSRMTGVNKTNSQKFEVLKSSKIRRIEEIAFPVMKELGYEVKYAKRYKPFSEAEMFFFKFIDFFNFKIKNKQKGY